MDKKGSRIRNTSKQSKSTVKQIKQWNKYFALRKKHFYEIGRGIVCRSCNSEFENVDDLFNHIPSTSKCNKWYVNRPNLWDEIFDSMAQRKCVSTPAFKKKYQKDLEKQNAPLAKAGKKPLCILFRPNSQADDGLKPPKCFLNVDDYFYFKLSGNKTYKRKLHIEQFTCYSCRKILRSNLRFMSHSRHKVLNVWQKQDHDNLCNRCSHCYQLCKSPDDLKLHIEKCHALSNVQTVCEICEQYFESEQKFLVHMKATHSRKETPYICYVCNYRSSFYNDVVHHFKSMHAGTEFLQCCFCLQVRNVQNNFLTHIIAHVKNCHKCNKCRLQFVSVSDLQSHVQLEHVTNMLQLEPGSDNLVAHEVYVHINYEKKEEPTKHWGLQNKLEIKSEPNVSMSDEGSPSGPGQPRPGQIIETPDLISKPKFAKLPSYLQPVIIPMTLNRISLKQRYQKDDFNGRFDCWECKNTIGRSQNDFRHHFSAVYECKCCSYMTSCKYACDNHIIVKHAEPDLTIDFDSPEDEEFTGFTREDIAEKKIKIEKEESDLSSVTNFAQEAFSNRFAESAKVERGRRKLSKDSPKKDFTTISAEMVAEPNESLNPTKTLSKNEKKLNGNETMMEDTSVDVETTTVSETEFVTSTPDEEKPKIDKVATKANKPANGGISESVKVKKRKAYASKIKPYPASLLWSEGRKLRDRSNMKLHDYLQRRKRRILNAKSKTQESLVIKTKKTATSENIMTGEVTKHRTSELEKFMNKISHTYSSILYPEQETDYIENSFEVEDQIAASCDITDDDVIEVNSSMQPPQKPPLKAASSTASDFAELILTDHEIDQVIDTKPIKKTKPPKPVPINEMKKPIARNRKILAPGYYIPDKPKETETSNDQFPYKFTFTKTGLKKEKAIAPNNQTITINKADLNMPNERNDLTAPTGQSTPQHISIAPKRENFNKDTQTGEPTKYLLINDPKDNKILLTPVGNNTELMQMPRPPTHLRFSLITSTSVVVQWSHPEFCTFTQYKIVFKGIKSPTSKLLPPNQAIVRLVDLIPDTNYDVKVYSLCKNLQSHYVQGGFRTLSQNYELVKKKKTNTTLINNTLLVSNKIVTAVKPIVKPISQAAIQHIGTTIPIPITTNSITVNLKSPLNKTITHTATSRTSIPIFLPSPNPSTVNTSQQNVQVGSMNQNLVQPADRNAPQLLNSIVKKLQVNATSATTITNPVAATSVTNDKQQLFNNLLEHFQAKARNVTTTNSNTAVSTGGNISQLFNPAVRKIASKEPDASQKDNSNELPADMARTFLNDMPVTVNTNIDDNLNITGSSGAVVSEPTNEIGPSQPVELNVVMRMNNQIIAPKEPQPQLNLSKYAKITRGLAINERLKLLDKIIPPPSKNEVIVLDGSDEENEVKRSQVDDLTCQELCPETDEELLSSTNTIYKAPSPQQLAICKEVSVETNNEEPKQSLDNILTAQNEQNIGSDKPYDLPSSIKVPTLEDLKIAMLEDTF